MALELFANNAATTLNGGINNSVTTITVTSAAAFPSTGNFRIMVDSEIMLVTAVSTNDFTVTRGAESTSAASHLTGVAVTQVITKAGLGQTIQDNAYGLFYGMTPPDDSLFAWVNQQSGVTTQMTWGVNVNIPGISAGQNTCARVISAPATPYHIETYIEPVTLYKGDLGYGLIFRESGTGKLVMFLMQVSGGVLTCAVYKCASATAVTALYANTQFTLSKPPGSLRIGDNGTNLTFDFSPDLHNWWNLFSVSRTDYLAGGPNQVGHFGYPANAATPLLPCSYTVSHWKATA